MLTSLIQCSADGQKVQKEKKVKRSGQQKHRSKRHQSNQLEVGTAQEKSIQFLWTECIN